MGTIRTYVGRTALTMGSDPAYAAFADNGDAAVFDDHDNAVWWLEAHGDCVVTDQEDQ